ncbi:MAG: hypothetical protein K2K77_08315, partial [Duncaniella sp.]|nr:hypothetical protein [Duncaniella sp.]
GGGRVAYTMISPTMLCSLVMSCSGGEERKASIYRLDSEISHGIMPDDPKALHAAERLFEISRYPELNQFTIGDYAEKQSIREHVKGVESEFTDTERESRALGKIFASIQEQLPEVKIPDVYTIISPFAQSIFVTDSMLYIGLNHYLGPDYEAYEYFPEYVRRLKVRERIPLDVTEALVRTSYPFVPATDYPQAVQRLAYEGAVALAMERLTGASTRDVLGYDADQYKWLDNNEGQMWRALAERQLLFSTDGAVIRSLVDVGPHTSVLSPDSPGRAGRYIGRKLVGAYMDNDKNDAVSLRQLLSPEFYNDPALLTKAGYYP